MKFPIFIFLCFQIHNNLQLKDGESMKIDIDAEGKKSVKFMIDGHSFKIDLLRGKLQHEGPDLPQEILDNQVAEYDLQQKLDQNFQDELDKSHINLNGLTEEEKQEEINNIKVKTLKDQGIPLDEAAEFVKKREDFDKFSIDQFSLSIQEYLERMRTEFDIVKYAKEKKQEIELNIQSLLVLQDEIDLYLRNSKVKAQSDPQDENKSIHINIITHVTNIIDDLFTKLKENQDKGSHNYELYYQYIDTLEKELKKIN